MRWCQRRVGACRQRPRCEFRTLGRNRIHPRCFQGRDDHPGAVLGEHSRDDGLGDSDSGHPDCPQGCRDQGLGDSAPRAPVRAGTPEEGALESLPGGDLNKRKCPNPPDSCQWARDGGAVSRGYLSGQSRAAGMANGWGGRGGQTITRAHLYLSCSRTSTCSEGGSLMRSVRVPAQALAWDRLTDGGFNSESLSLCVSVCLSVSLTHKYTPHFSIH